jgi:hypothetical protein
VLLGARGRDHFLAGLPAASFVQDCPNDSKTVQAFLGSLHYSKCALLGRFLPRLRPLACFAGGPFLCATLPRCSGCWSVPGSPACQATRERNAVYGYLNAVYGLVTWWKAEGREADRARRALCLQRSFGAPPTRREQTNERAANGAGSCGTRRCARRTPRPWKTSSDERVGSMPARVVSRGASGGVRQPN